jgi:hypothetical protein
MYGFLLGGYEFEFVVGLHKMQDQTNQFFCSIYKTKNKLHDFAWGTKK